MAPTATAPPTSVPLDPRPLNPSPALIAFPLTCNQLTFTILHSVLFFRFGVFARTTLEALPYPQVIGIC
ncbi:hypothetical protein L226DRAFT_351494 [Lentinus tigrinus ALCF2SS1-7]|uniref:uncharacterized protein n=1 Tax=Lentinus tigrinus ALCF2SS1-7 TaxID=1328758 RepID=UPI001165FCC3|nr:hypothetical protein L226DRAFT_351494 [Lentinus tigrinus ALCF2SS1-7]